MKSKLVNGMIELNEIDVRLIHKNDRLEKHGDDDVLACDLEFTWETNNDQLALFDPTLRADLYAADPNLDRKKGGEIPGVETSLTLLKHPQVSVYKWDGHEIVGGKFMIHGIVSGKDMEFGLANINKWRIEPMQGGTVIIKFRVQVIPEKKQRGQLMDLLETGTASVSVIPPEPTPDAEQP